MRQNQASRCGGRWVAGATIAMVLGLAGCEPQSDTLAGQPTAAAPPKGAQAAPAVAAPPSAASRAVEPSTTPPGSVAGPGYNVLLISLDTTRADRLGCYGYEKAKTPNIDRLAAGGTRFSQCISPVPLTLPSHCSIFTGTPPFVHGVRDNLSFALSANHQTFTEALQAAGYTTGAEVGSAVMNREFGLDQGFDHYGDVVETRAWRDPLSTDVRRPCVERPADVVTDAAIAWLRSAASKKFFLFVHYFDPHAPYAAPGGLAGAATPYDAEIAFVDQQVGRLLAELRELALEKKTLVMLLGDHGEGLGEHGQETHSYFVYDSTLHVPLILSCPEQIPAGKVIDAQVRLIDAAPTILEFVGLPPLPKADGVSLLAFVAGKAGDLKLPAYAESMYPKLSVGCGPYWALRSDGWKLIYSAKPELYHVAEDPRETRDLAAAEPQRVAAMTQQLATLLAAADGAAGAARTEVDPDTLAELRRLGYIGDSPEEEEMQDLFAFGPAVPDPRSCYEEFSVVDRAVSQVSAGKYAAAIKTLETLLAQSARPQAQTLARRTLAEAFIAMGMFHKALPHYAAALQVRPDDATLRCTYARALMQTGRLAQALEEYRRVIAMNPRWAGPYFEYSAALARRGRHAEALEQAQRALAVDPSFAPAQAQIGEVLVRLGMLDHGIAEMRKAIALAPESPSLGVWLANLLVEHGLAEDGLKEFQDLRKRFPKDATVLAGLGRTNRILHRFAEAQEALEKAVEAEPKAPKLWLELAQVHLDQRHYADAFGVYQVARGANPSDSTILAALAWLLATTPNEEQRDVLKAAEIAEMLAEAEQGQNPRVLDALAAALAGQGEFKRARETQARAVGLAERLGDAEYVRELTMRLRLYDEQREFRLPPE